MAKKPNHPHHCECAHDEVRYCGGCKVVHCLACKQEWSFTPCERSHGYPWTWGQYPVTYTHLIAETGATSTTFAASAKSEGASDSSAVHLAQIALGDCDHVVNHYST